MTKADMIDHIWNTRVNGRHPLTKHQTSSFVDAVFEYLTHEIRKNKRASVPGFGTWTVKKRKARKGRNPKTGEAIAIPVTRAIVFRPAPNLKASVVRRHTASLGTVVAVTQGVPENSVYDLTVEEVMGARRASLKGGK